MVRTIQIATESFSSLPLTTGKSSTRQIYENFLVQVLLTKQMGRSNGTRIVCIVYIKSLSKIYAIHYDDYTS
jgi:hypothetical protein